MKNIMENICVVSIHNNKEKRTFTSSASISAFWNTLEKVWYSELSQDQKKTIDWNVAEELATFAGVDGKLVCKGEKEYIAPKEFSGKYKWKSESFCVHDSFVKSHSREYCFIPDIGAPVYGSYRKEGVWLEEIK